MNLVITNFDKDMYVLKPFISGKRNIESLIARIKMIILENPTQQAVLDLRKINFLDCIKIGTIIGTYHFLGFSGKKIHMLVDNEELQKAIEKLCFDNIEIHIGDNKFALAGIA